MDLYAPVGPYNIMLQANRKSQTQKSSLQHQHVGLMLIIWSVAHMKLSAMELMWM